MLVVSRKIGESIQLDIEGLSEPITIKITLTNIKGDNAKIGIEAPRDTVRVARSEIIDRFPSFQEIPDVASVS